MTCQNCKQNFAILPEDTAFYEKMQVPPPTFCPVCRFQRRTMFRNERVLYRRQCDLCKKEIISIHAADKPYPVYCNPCWWSDSWDQTATARPYDPSRSFFEQYRELVRSQPQVALVVDLSTLENSDYSNHVGHVKNCYLLFDANYCGNTHYSTSLNACKDSMDMHLVWESELCYAVINGTRVYRTFYSEDCTDCHEVYFSKNLTGCSNCFGCINLKNKSYHIFNEPYSKEDYDKKISEFALHSWEGLSEIRERVRTFWLTHPHKAMRERMTENVSGDYIYESKNAHECFQVRGVEDSKFCTRLNVKTTKDSYDYFEWGFNAQRVYECITVGEEVDSIKFSFFVLHSFDIEYAMMIFFGQNLFGCAGLRNKKFCILNKQYSQKAFVELRDRIIADMTQRPYKDQLGRMWKYGEFPPYDLSLFGYNESTAMQYDPLAKEVALARGYPWYDTNPGAYKITLETEKIPDSIMDVTDSITKEMIGCVTCGKPYRIIKHELELLRKFGLPIPRACPDCRAGARMARLAPSFFHDRTCAKCGRAIQTSYAPERPELVYCQTCYEGEVI